MPKGSKNCSVQVSLGERSYPIRITSAKLDKLGPEVAARTESSHAVIVTQPSIGRRYAGLVAQSLRAAGIKVRRLNVPEGDRNKSLKTAARLYDSLLDLGADRNTAMLALGGGVVGDLTGYVAATFMRGIPFVQIPTTLLAMVDASIGGKTAINLSRGKNLVGVFYQPRLVWADVATLQTLPRKLISCGLAEVIKHAAIWDASLFELLERDIERILALQEDVLIPIIKRNCEIKAEIVSLDEYEEDLRTLLNFGHTVGHAVEGLRRYRGEHGDAVAIGMVYAGRYSEELGYAPIGTSERIRSLVERANLPTELPDFSRKRYLHALRVDKKRSGSHIKYVVLEDIGRAKTVSLRPGEILPRRSGGRGFGFK